MSRTIQWCDGPTPSASRPPVHRVHRQRLARQARSDAAPAAARRRCPARCASCARAHQRHHGQAVEVVGHLRHPRGVQARGFGPLDVGEQLVDLAGHVAALGPDHHSKAHCSPLRFALQVRDLRRVSARTSRTRTSSGVPVGNTAAAPAASSLGTSACGIVPPTTTAMSPASAARSASTVRVGQRHVRAGQDAKARRARRLPARAIDAMSSMRWRIPV